MELQGPGIGPLSLIVCALLLNSFYCCQAQDLRVVLKRSEAGHKNIFTGFDVEVKRGSVFGASREIRQENHASLPVSCDGLGEGEYRSVRSHGGFLRWEGRSLRGEVRLLKSKSECLIVNFIDLESYVAGLLNSEMAGHWPLESLKAQAVAARTYAVYLAKKNQDKYFDLESTTKDQVYDGAHREMYQTHLATRMTKDEILTFRGLAVKAFYHSTCAGRTESPDQVWGEGHPAFRSVLCPYCKNSPRLNWSLDLDLKSLSRKLEQSGHSLQGEPLAISVAERTPSGRAKTIEIVVSSLRMLWPTSFSAPFKGFSGDYKTISLSVQKFRELIGFERVRSNSFEISEQNLGSSKIKLLGHGSGHGVGMCQWGAKEMGRRGIGYRTILKQYYPLTDLTRFTGP